MDEKIKSQLFDLDETIIGAYRKNQEDFDAGAIPREVFEKNKITVELLWREAEELRAAAKRGKNVGLQLARENAGLSQGQLAERVGVSRVWIHLIENGKRNGSGKMRNKISGVLNTAPAILWPDVEITKPETPRSVRARWADEVDEETKALWAKLGKTEAGQRGVEEEFDGKIETLFEALEKKLTPEDLVIYENADYQAGFQEILFLFKKHGIEVLNI